MLSVQIDEFLQGGYRMVPGALPPRFRFALATWSSRLHVDWTICRSFVAKLAIACLKAAQRARSHTAKRSGA
jgi:hypothetical protein